MNTQTFFFNVIIHFKVQNNSSQPKVWEGKF